MEATAKGTSAARPLIVLVDMDNTITHFNERAIERYEEVHKPKKPRSVDTLRYCNAADNYPLRQRELVQALCAEPGFMMSVKPVDGAIRALKEMRGMGIDVRICCAPSPSPAERIQWMEHHFHTPDWQERLVFTLDKTIIKGDYLIDDDPTPTTRTACALNTPEWEHVVFDKIYNRQVNDKKRITAWMNWKVELGLDQLQLQADKIKGNAAEIHSFRHGSEDSTDQDKYYVFPYPLSAREGQDFCSGTGQEDRNVINLENGVISWAFKGHSDECNNDLLHTYHLHEQLFPCPIARKVTRNVPRKVLGTMRKLNVMYYCDNAEAIQVIRYRSWEERRMLYRLIDFCQDSSLRVYPDQASATSTPPESSPSPAPAAPAPGTPSGHLDVQDLKTIATQLGMSVALLVGREVYTKRDIVRLYPELEPFIYRRQELIHQAEHLVVLNRFKDALLRALTHVRSKQDGHLVYYHLDDEFYRAQAKLAAEDGEQSPENALTFPGDDVAERNHFIYQCHGMASHFNTEDCSMFGLDSYHIPMGAPSWPYMPPKEYMKRFKEDGEIEVGAVCCLQRDIWLQYADLEQRSGGIDRARAIYAHSSQSCNPTEDSDFWTKWKDFEICDGNEDTFKEMLRAKRLVQATFNTPETELTEASTTSDRPSARGRWGRLLHVFAFAGKVMVGNVRDMVDEEGRALLLRSVPAFETALDFGRYHHVFRIFRLLPSSLQEAGGEVEGVDVALLVALRSTFSCEIIGEEETYAYAAAIGCPTLRP